MTHAQRSMVGVAVGEVHLPPIAGDQHSIERIAALDSSGRGLDFDDATVVIRAIAVDHQDSRQRSRPAPAANHHPPLISSTARTSSAAVGSATPGFTSPR